MSTIDKNGNKVFIDRTDKKYKGEPLRKIIDLDNIGIYWNTKPCILIGV